MAGLQPTAATVAVGRVSLVLGAFFLALFAAWGFPRLDYVVNAGAAQPGLISYLGVGLAVLALTALGDRIARLPQAGETKLVA